MKERGIRGLTIESKSSSFAGERIMSSLLKRLDASVGSDMQGYPSGTGKQIVSDLFIVIRAISRFEIIGERFVMAG